MTASVLTQDPNTYKVQKNAIYYEKKKKKKREREREKRNRVRVCCAKNKNNDFECLFVWNPQS